MSKPSLGLAMITLNEEVHIPATIPQFYNVVDDIAVIDGGSTDATVDWCNRLGARVIHHKFENDFPAQKNRAIEALDTDWIYLHDPDERLEPPLLEILPLLITDEGQRFLMSLGVLPAKSTYFDCFGIARKNYIDGIQTEVYPDYQYRIFRNHCRFKNSVIDGIVRVHEQITNFEDRTEIDFDRNTCDTPSRLNILHYKSSERQDQQNIFYAKIEKELNNANE